MNVDYSKKFNFSSTLLSSLFPILPTTFPSLKIVGIALAALASLFYVVYVKMGLEGRLSRKARPLIHSPLSSLFIEALSHPIPENAHQLKECSLTKIEDFLKQHRQVKDVYIKSLPVPTALLNQLIQQKLPLDEKTLTSLYVLENAKGEKFQLTGFEKALMMQHSVSFYNFWKGRDQKQINLIQDSDEFELLKILLQSLYEPKILEQKEREICSLAATSFKFHLNKKRINKCLEKLLVASFEKNDTQNIAILLKFFKHYQKPLIPSIQQALQKWLNASIGTSTFSSNIQLLNHFSLDTLDFSQTSISDQELSYVSELSLSTLILRNCQITDQGIEYLKHLTQLQKLDLGWSSQITDQGIEYLKGLTQLQKLDLRECNLITDQGIEHLKSLIELKELNLRWCNELTDQGMEHLKGLTQLQKLNLIWCSQLTDQGMEHLTGLTQLQKLNLFGCSQITDQGLKCLKGLSQLQKLDLYHCNQITDQGMKYLKGLSQLEKLELGGCSQITDQGLKCLKRLSQLQTLDLRECNQITNKGLIHLYLLDNLKSLNLLNSCPISLKNILFFTAKGISIIY